MSDSEAGAQNPQPQTTGEAPQAGALPGELREAVTLLDEATDLLPACARRERVGEEAACERVARLLLEAAERVRRHGAPAGDGRA